MSADILRERLLRDAERYINEAEKLLTHNQNDLSGRCLVLAATSLAEVAAAPRTLYDNNAICAQVTLHVQAIGHVVFAAQKLGQIEADEVGDLLFNAERALRDMHDAAIKSFNLQDEEET